MNILPKTLSSTHLYNSKIIPTHNYTPQGSSGSDVNKIMKIYGWISRGKLYTFNRSNIRVIKATGIMIKI